MRHSTITRSVRTEQINQDHLQIFAVKTTRSGSVRSVTYVDLSTGEVIEAKDLSIGVVDLRQKLPARAHALGSLREEVEAFASFVLRFANKRRGITPGIEVLCKWFGELHGKQTGHVRRYIPVLLKAGILAGDTLLGPPFQRTGGETRSHLGEDYRAWCIFQMLKRDRFKLTTATQPSKACPALVVDEVARLDAELEADRIIWAWQRYRPAAKPRAANSITMPDSQYKAKGCATTDVECAH